MGHNNWTKLSPIDSNCGIGYLVIFYLVINAAYNFSINIIYVVFAFQFYCSTLHKQLHIKQYLRWWIYCSWIHHDLLLCGGYLHCKLLFLFFMKSSLCLFCVLLFFHLYLIVLIFDLLFLTDYKLFLLLFYV